MTINELAQRMLTEQSEKQGDAGYLSMLENWIRGAIRDVAIKSKWRFFKKYYTFNTVIGTTPTTAIYDLPEEVRDFEYMQIVSTDQRIDYKEPADIVDDGEDLQLVSTPKNWFWQNAGLVGSDFVRRIRLHPIPSAVLTIEAPYFYHPVNLVSASQIPLSEEFESILENYIRSYMLSIDKDYDGANAQMQMYSNGLAGLIITDRKTAAKRRIAKVSDLPRATRTRRTARLPY